MNYIGVFFGTILLLLTTEESLCPFPWSDALGTKRVSKEPLFTPPKWAIGLPMPLQSSPSLQRIVQEVSALDCIKFQLPAAHATAGKVLQHSLKIMDDLLDTHAPAIFKVGFTHNPAWRWSNDLYGYAKSVEKYSNMIVLYITDEPWGPAMLEAALIQHYRGILVCKSLPVACGSFAQYFSAALIGLCCFDPNAQLICLRECQC